jgi:hypothetical protein
MTNPLALTVALLATTSFVLAGGEGEKKGGDKAAAKSTPSVLSHLSGWGYNSANFDAAVSHSMQLRVDYTDTDEGRDVMNVDVRRVRSSASGSVYGLDYKVQNDWTEDNSIKDAWLNWNMQDSDAYSVGVKVGQYKTAFGREFNTSYTNLEFMDRSNASDHFSGTRSRAVTVHGAAKASGLNWAVSMANDSATGADEAGDNDHNEMDYTFSVNWSSNAKAVRMGGSEGALNSDAGFGLGFAHFKGNGIDIATGTNTETESNNIWASWKNNSGIAANLEMFTSEGEIQDGAVTSDEDGYSASLSWTAAAVEGQAQWGVAVRYSGIENDTADSEDNRFEVVFNRYSAGHNYKTQFGLTHNSDKTGTANHVEDYVLGVQTTVVF